MVLNLIIVEIEREKERERERKRKKERERERRERVDLSFRPMIFTAKTVESSHVLAFIYLFINLNPKKKNEKLKKLKKIIHLFLVLTLFCLLKNLNFFYARK